MSLIAATKEDLPIGTPLPWPLFDQDGAPLVAQGEVIATEAELDALLSKNPLRELTWNAGPASEKDAELESREASDSRELDAALASGQATSFTFHDMRLRVGDRIQIQPPANVATERYVVKVIGYVDGVSLLVTAPLQNGFRVPLRDNDKIIGRVFSSQKAFGFVTFVEKVCKIPFDYLHLSFPTEIQGSVIRKSPRVRTKIIASIAKPDAAESGERLSGVIANLSANGALVKARRQLTDKGGVIQLAFRVNLHGVDAYLSVNALVCSTFEDEEKSSTPFVSHGVQFQNLQPNDSVILQSLIYQQMIEQPHSLA